MSPPNEAASARSDHPSPAVSLILRGRPRDLGGFTVRRTLPAMQRRTVGPFVFFDHMGPTAQPPGSGMDVRPHPHISLATVTYLFDGEIFHKDSLGSAQAIRPGDVNWMTAGRGIAHSERTSPEVRARGQLLHGIQAWVALPQADEECAPSFAHHPEATLPQVEIGGARLRVIAGDAFGQQSPVKVATRTLYVDAVVPAGATLEVPVDHEERAVYVVSGEMSVTGAPGGADADPFTEGDMVILVFGEPLTLRATVDTRAMLLGGARLDGERHIWWNFVSSSPARIEDAKRAWKNGEFARVVGDENEFIPLPES